MLNKLFYIDCFVAIVFYVSLQKLIMSKASDREFAHLHVKNIPLDVYNAIQDCVNEEQKRFRGMRKCGLRDGITKLVREYLKLKGND